MSDLVVDIVVFAIRPIIEGLFTLTGEIVLFVVTLGAHRPRWDLYASGRPMAFALLSELSLWVGTAFWVATAVAAYFLFFR